MRRVWGLCGLLLALAGPAAAQGVGQLRGLTLLGGTTPESNVTAPVGTITWGTTEAHLYQKCSGSGSTGWESIYVPCTDQNRNLGKSGTNRWVTVYGRNVVLESYATGTGGQQGNTVLIGRNTSGDGAAGCLQLTSRAGTNWASWIDADGKWRISTACPQEDGSPSDTGGVALYLQGGPDVQLADGGTGSSLAAPGADRILFYDQSAGGVTWLQAGNGITISGTTIQTTSNDPSDLPSAFFLTDYGAACDGTTDDSAALQAVFDAAAATDTGGATIYLPAATCAFASTVTLGGGDGPGDGSTWISIIGVGALASQLTWTGSTSATALVVSLNKHFQFEGFSVNNGAGSRGTTKGIVLTGPLTVGTQTFYGELRHLRVDGFETCVQAGENTVGKAASEMLYTQVSMHDCTYGWRNYDLNTLDHEFWQSGCAESDYCIYATTGNVYFNGGSMSNNSVADFYLGGVDETFSIRDVRSENAGYFLKFTGSNGRVLLTSNLVTAPADDDDVAIYYDAKGHLTLINNVIEGKVLLTQGGQELVMQGNAVARDDTTNLPFFVSQGDSTPGYLNRARIWAIANRDYSTDYQVDSAVPMADFTGIWNGYLPRPMTTTSWDDVQTTLPEHRLNRVAMLAENSAAAGRNLRVAVTFASSSTASVTFQHAATLDSTSGGATGTQRYDATAGAFTTADVGKFIQIGSTYGYIYDVVDSDTIDVAPAPSNSMATGSSLSATIGLNEPDADYMPFPSCSANETFSWSSRGTSGFTLTSSNASSTATCFVLIVR